MMSLEETFTGPIIIATNGPKRSLEPSKFTGLIVNRGQYKHIHVEEQGQCKAVNAAAATVNTPWIFVTNDDMVYAPGWFDRLTTNLVGEEIMGKIPACISPQLVEPKLGAPTFLIEFCGGAGGDFNKEKWLDYAKKMVLDSLSYDQNKGIRTGFNLPYLISKELWDTVGGYDVNYDPWGSNSDSDLEYKIRLAGIQPYQNTNCLVYHFSQTSGTFHPDNQSYWQKNWDYFIEKWGFPRTDEGIWEASFTIPETNKFHPEWEGKYGSK
jgi:hypothetical protein